MKKSKLQLFLLAIALQIATGIASAAPIPVAVPDGYATQNGGTTGGGSAAPVTVATAEEFRAAVKGDKPAVIIVKGRLELGGNVSIGSNKTIIGADTNSGFGGGSIGINGSNYILQNLTIGPAKGDLVEISGAKNVFITKCQFYGCTDELCSIVRESDYVTVSWCKFYFPDTHSHAFGSLVGNRDDATGDRGKLRVTMHHNWYAEGVRARMPRVRFGQVHLYNNYYNSVGSGYCIGAGKECHIRLENSVFENVKQPWADYGGKDTGEIGWANLKFIDSSEPTFMPNKFPVFALPYDNKIDPTDQVKAIVTAGAGNVTSPK